MYELEIDPGQLQLADLQQVISQPRVQVRLADSAAAAIHASQQVVQSVIEQDRVVYGINTGFGLLANRRIDRRQLDQLQRNLVLSHAAGTGDPLPDPVVRLVLLLKINSLALGFSGVRPVVIDALCRLLNEDCLPVIPGQGSVGACGDLAPLAHLSSALLGVGQVRLRGQLLDASTALRQLDCEPLKLAPKEGLALLNGTQVSTALALTGLFRTWDVFAAAVVAGAMSTDASLGSDVPFDPRIHRVRRHRGQIDCATSYRSLLAGSAIRQSHASADDCEKVQDPYSLRCQPQVMGACLDHLRFVAGRLWDEANAVSDNPLVFADQPEVLSGGNFHAEPVAMAADAMAVAIAEIGALSERRTALLMDEHLSGLPPFLVRDSGLNSGFMIAQVTAAALASENKSLAHPASVDSLPTSANQEDHVSMATFAARRLLSMTENTSGIVAVELLAAAQGLDLRAPLKSSESLQQAVQMIRSEVPHYDTDRWFHSDIQSVKRLIQQGYFRRAEFHIPRFVQGSHHADHRPDQDPAGS